MEDWVTIKKLKAKNPGMSFREIGKMLQISHHTVKSALGRESDPEYDMSGRQNPKLAAFQEVIFEMVNVKRFRGSRIFEELRSKGYTGGKTALYAYLGKVKIEVEKHYTPYETLPGEQSQFDWSPYTVSIGGELTGVKIFSYVNGFSRKQILEVSLSEDQGSVFEAMENSLVESGGVPGRIQTDNAKVFVKNASKSNFQWNERYLQFCGHYGFEPSRSLPAHPWSKGKVEKPFQYLEDHFIAGSTFDSFEDLQAKLKAFQYRVATRIHATIKTTPESLLVEDQKAFSALPQTRYIGIREEIRKVSFDCLFSFGGSRYSAPWMFAGKQIWIRVARGYYLEAYSQANKLIARHKLATSHGSCVVEKAHYRGNRSDIGNFERLRALFLESFPEYEMFLEKLQAQKRINARRHLMQFLELAKLYEQQDMVEAIKACMQYNVYNGSFVTGYLEKHCRHALRLPSEPFIHHLYAIEATRGEGVTCDLREYQLNQPSEGGE